MAEQITVELPASSPAHLVQVEDALRRYAHFGAGCPDHLTAAIAHSLLGGGKRLRPLLVLYAAQACGSAIEPALPAACAVEMVHTYSLIHDDLPAMDDDDMRRGQPSCHVAFDEATAILAGDALLARAFELLAIEITPAETAVRCGGELAAAAGASQLVGGQADDLKMAGQTFAQDADALVMLEAIHARKTGALLVVSLRLGGLVAGADGGQLDQLTKYGQNLGLTFQITDDLLDLRGDSHTLGKTVGKDDQQGKLTYPAILGVEASRRRAQQLTQSACAAVASLGPAADDLHTLARFVLDRDH